SRSDTALAPLLQYARGDGSRARAARTAPRRARCRLTSSLHRGRILAWIALIALLAVPSYALRIGGTLIGLQPDDLFKYSTAIAAISVDAVLLLIVLVIARGLPFRETFGLRAPTSWRRSFVIGLATLVAAYAISFLEVAIVSGAGREQGVPEFWDPTRIGAWAANLFAIAVFVPIFEESLCRGLGYALFAPFGGPVAVLIT